MGDREDPQSQESVYRVYKRHLSQGLTKPDDGDNPKISFRRDALEPRPRLSRGFFFPSGGPRNTLHSETERR
jgi:hypothetical protein